MSARWPTPLTSASTNIYQFVRRAFSPLSTCPHGVLHLHEEFVAFQPEWLDKAAGKFVPISRISAAPASSATGSTTSSRCAVRLVHVAA